MILSSNYYIKKIYSLQPTDITKTTTGLIQILFVPCIYYCTRYMKNITDSVKYFTCIFTFRFPTDLCFQALCDDSDSSFHGNACAVENFTTKFGQVVVQQLLRDVIKLFNSILANSTFKSKLI